MKRSSLRYIVALISLTIVLLLNSCCPCRHATAESSAKVRDSVYIVHYDTIRIERSDTLWLERLEQSHDQITTYAQHSELSNAYCISTANITADGALAHTLDTRDSAMLPVRIIDIERIVRDTIFRDKVEVAERTSVKYVPKPKTLWHHTKDAMLIGLAVLAAWQNRKTILSIIRLWRI